MWILPVARSTILVEAERNTPIETTEPSPTMTPSTTSERAPMKQLSSMMVGIGLQRLQHAADADAARQMHVLADLRAGADGDPGVDHRARIDIGAEIDEGGHQHDVGRDIGGLAHDAAGHRAKAGLGEAVLAPAGEFRGHLVPPGCAAGAARDDCAVVEAERQQHRLFQPLMDLPGSGAGRAWHFLGDARLPAVEQGQAPRRPPRALRPWFAS